MLTKIHTITSDNGLENSKLLVLKIDWYATNAYSSWQKGKIEQKHRQIRKFIPKGKTLDNLTQEQCDLIALIINCETFLNNKWYKLGKIVTDDELETYFNLIDDEKSLKEVLELE